MKDQVKQALKSIEEAKTVRAVRRAADTAYVNHRAPGGPDQTELQKAVIERKKQVTPEAKQPESE